MELLMQKQINQVFTDGYYEAETKDAWFTRVQIGELLEYEDPQHAILKIHQKHKERLDKFSRRSQFDTPSGKQIGYIYNIRGVFEICRWSRQPKADEIMDKLYDFAESIVKKGYATVLSDEELYKLLAEKLHRNQKAISQNIIIPALYSADVSASTFINSLVGDYPLGRTFYNKIFEYDRKNRAGQAEIRKWLKTGIKPYTAEKVAKEIAEKKEMFWRVKLALSDAAYKIYNQKGIIGKNFQFAENIIYFDITGLGGCLNVIKKKHLLYGEDLAALEEYLKAERAESGAERQRQAHTRSIDKI